MHIIFVILLSFLLILSISIISFSLQTGISPMPSHPKVKAAVLSLLPEKSKKIYELGSGWGGVTFGWARRFPAKQFFAFELSYLPWLFSIAMQKIFRCRNVHIFRKNFYHVNLKEADVVYCYLFPQGMHQLKEKFERELRSGVYVISNVFAVPGWIPTTVITVNDLLRTKIYIYKTKHEDT